MKITSIELYNLLRAKLGEKESASLVQLIEVQSEESVNSKTETLATRVQLSELKSDLVKWMFIFWCGQIAVITAILGLYL